MGQDLAFLFVRIYRNTLAQLGGEMRRRQIVIAVVAQDIAMLTDARVISGKRQLFDAIIRLDEIFALFNADIFADK